jgi:hypothetical protein
LQIGENLKLKSRDDDYNDEIYIFENLDDESEEDSQMVEK